MPEFDDRMYFPKITEALLDQIEEKLREGSCSYIDYPLTCASGTFKVKADKAKQKTYYRNFGEFIENGFLEIETSKDVLSFSRDGSTQIYQYQQHTFQTLPDIAKVSTLVAISLGRNYRQYFSKLISFYLQIF